VQNDPQTNADSNALFASGTWIIVAPDGSHMTTDGTFGQPRTNPKPRVYATGSTVVRVTQAD
jgi:hypothetical protein